MQAISSFESAHTRAGFRNSRTDAVPGGKLAAPIGFALLRPVYGIAGAGVAGASLYFGGIAGATIAIGALIALWAFAEARTALWLATAFMVFLFVFFQSTAPLGEELPAEFLFWGIGVALITAGLVAATLFSPDVNWALTRKRLSAPASLAMAAMAIVILAPRCTVWWPETNFTPWLGNCLDACCCRAFIFWPSRYSGRRTTWRCGCGD